MGRTLFEVKQGLETNDEAKQSRHYQAQSEVLRRRNGLGALASSGMSDSEHALDRSMSPIELNDLERATLRS